MGINNFNYHYYGNKINPNLNYKPSFKGEEKDEEFKKKFDAIINTRRDLINDKKNLEKLVTKETIPVFECLATQKETDGYYDRFTGMNISKIMELTNEDNVKMVLSFLNLKDGKEYKFDPYEISILLKIVNKENYGFVDKLIQERKDITAFYLQDLLTIPNLDKELLFEFVDYKDEDKYKYSFYSISHVAKFLKEENKELIHSFFENTKNSDDNGMTGLAEILEKSNTFQKQYAIELLNKRDVNNKPLYDTFTISNITPKVTPKNIETVRKFVDWNDDKGKNIFSPMYIESLVKNDNLFRYEDLLSQIIEKNKDYDNSFIKLGDSVALTFSVSAENIDNAINEIGEENLLKLPIDELYIAFQESWGKEEQYERGVKNLKTIKENTPKEIWDNMSSISAFSFSELLEPKVVAERMGYLNNFPEHLVKRMDAEIMKLLLSDEFRPEDYQISQDAIKYFEGVNPKILDKIPSEMILFLILIPEDAHSIKEGLDFLCSLEPETFEKIKPLTNQILYAPGDMHDEGYKFNKDSAKEVLITLSNELSPQLFEMLDYDCMPEILIAYDTVIDKETFSRNISFLNKLVEEEVPIKSYSISKILKANKNIDLEKNRKLVNELMSFENFEKLIKKYKGSDLEETLRKMFDVRENDNSHFGFESNQRNRDISLLLTQENLDEKSFTKAFETFAKTVKMANRELVKRNLETGEVSYNFINGTSYKNEEEARKHLNLKFKESFVDIINALSITDSGTINNLLNRRFNQFKSQIDIINNLNPEDKKTLNMLIKDCGILNANGKVVMIPDRDKIDFITLLRANRRLIANGNWGIDFNNYIKDTTGYSVENKNIKKIIDVKALKAEILKRALINSGISEQELSKIPLNNLKWDTEYTHLLFAKPPRDKGELATVIKESTLGNFQNFITDETNAHGIANANTENAFYEAGVNFDVWDKKEAQELKVTSKIGNENLNIELWNRDPQESLFDGSYTTCCTALDAGNGGSMARYLLNKSFNVVEIKNDKGKTFAMSRIYMANVEDKPSLIMENIEINNNWLDTLSNKDKKQLKDSISEYMKKFADNLSENEIPIYFSTSYNKLEHLWKQENNIVEKEIEFIGDISPKDIYMNTFKGYTKPVGQKTKAQFYKVQ